MKINNVKKVIINIFNKRKEHTVLPQMPPDTVELSKKAAASKRPVLPFDAAARLTKLGVQKENIEKIIKTVNGNKDHYQKIARMLKAGFDENLVPDIFDVCKKYFGQLNVPLYNAAFELKNSGVEQKYISKVIKHFKTQGGKFDTEAYNRFEALRKRTLKENIIADAFNAKQREAMINEKIYNNISVIKKTPNIEDKNIFLVFG